MNDVWSAILEDESDWIWHVIYRSDGSKYCISQADCSLFDN